MAVALLLTTHAANAQCNSTGWSPVGLGMTLGDPVRVLKTLGNNDIIVGGKFAVAGGATARNIARWDGATFSSLGPGLAGSGGFDDGVYAVAQLDNGDSPSFNGIIEKGIIFQYVDNADYVAECPTNMRRSTQPNASPTNSFGEPRNLNFDYSFLDETQGAQMGLQIFAAWLKPGSPGFMTNVLPTGAEPYLVMLPGLPVFVEESTPLYNDTSRQGGWGNWDQVTQRHNRGGHMAYWDGQVGLFKQTEGGSPNTREAGADFEANHVYVKTKTRWYKASDHPNWQVYGWINSPR